MKKYLIFLGSLVIALIAINLILKAVQKTKLPVVSTASEKIQDLAFAA